MRADAELINEISNKFGISSKTIQNAIDTKLYAMDFCGNLLNKYIFSIDI